jgi:surface carbohydrate biosynthesis protein
MIYKNIDYILYYEHITRELESIKKVKAYLDLMGYKGIILPIHYNRYINVIKYRPKIVIVPYLYSKNDSTFLRYKNLYGDVKCLNLHSEQISNKNTVDFMMPKDDYSRNVFHIAWGKKFAKALVENDVESAKIFITGSIRNDSIFDYEKRRHIKSDNILIPTSFSLTMVSDQYIDNLEQSMEKKKLKRNIEFMEKSRDDFFNLIYQAAKKFEDKKFFLRPHPHVDINLYINIFKMTNNIHKIPDNIYIEREGSIQEFFSKGNKIIAWHSTSILEGAMMNKDVAILAPLEFPPHMRMDFMEFINILNSKETLFNFINSNNIKQNNLDKYIYNNFYNVDGLSSLRVSHVISNIISSTVFQNCKSKKFFSYLLFKSITIDFPKNVLLKLGLLDKLFDNYQGIIEDNIEIRKLENSNIIEKDNLNYSTLFKKRSEGNYVNIIF